MGFIARRLIKQDLENVQVLINDTTNNYFNTVEVPSTFVQGRSAFKIFGSPLLKINVPLKMEMLDSAGNTVYMAPVDLVGEEVPPFLPYRFVTVEVYRPPINREGIGHLTILGEIDPAAVDFQIPSTFQNTYNVKYTLKINLDLSTVINTEPIRFYKAPFIQASEIVKSRIVNTPVTESIRVFTSGSANTSPSINNQSIPSTTGSMEHEDDITPYQPNKDIEKYAQKFGYKTGLYGGMPPIIKRRGGLLAFASPADPLQTVTIPQGNLTSNMQGGVLTIPQHTTTVAKTDGSGKTYNEDFTIPEFKSVIKEVINDHTLVLDEIPSFDDDEKVDHKIVDDFTDVPLTMSFQDITRTVISSSVYEDSFLNMTIKNMRTFSGDVYRIKAHGKMHSSNSGFAVIADTVIESPELLRDNESVSGFLRTGYFIDQNHINAYWTASSFDSNTKGAEIALTHTGSEYIDSLHISGSTAGVNESIVAETHPGYPFILEKNIVYTLSALIKGKTTDKINADGIIENNGKLYFHLSGSNLNSSKKVSTNTYVGTELTSTEDDRVVSLELDSNKTGMQDFYRVEHTFQPLFNLDVLRNVDTVLQLRATSGEWHVSDLSLRPAQDTGFSPDEYNIILPLPRTIRPDKLDVFIEYFDINSNTVETVTIAENIDISGSAFIMDGIDNLLTGSLYVGNVAGSGIELSGAGSAYMRAVGYGGFISASEQGNGGFMIWSGSVLPDAPDNYEGAGLEIHDGTTGVDESFLKFRTNPSEFKVKTDSFFLGSKTSGQFISGANSNIQISSSKFFLGDADNYVSGSDGNLKIYSTGDTTLSGSSVTIATPKFYLGGADQYVSGSDGKIEISSSNFHLTNTGDVVMQGTITAEAGGLIGGFTVNSSSLSSTNIFISGSPIAGAGGTSEDTQLSEYMFISSSNFNIKQSGEITGSKVLFDGGKIGGFEIAGGGITGSNLLISADSGELRTKDFQTGFTGWRISAGNFGGLDANGTAEFENVRIRGTLRTMVFEKETVNAVGGQLWIANSTALSGSASIDDTAFPCDNVSGFEIGEIVFAKKVTGTGFTKEYMKVTGSSRRSASSDNDMAGFLHVERAFGGTATASAFVGVTLITEAINSTETLLAVTDADPTGSNLLHETIRIGDEIMRVSGSDTSNNEIHVYRGVDGSPKAAHADNSIIELVDPNVAFLLGLVSPRESYKSGQVIVSTGRYISGTGDNTVGSGYIRLNANPTIGTTPYIDFAERTGSGIYDVKLRARVGDLSGLIRTKFGDDLDMGATPGFGLASENVFLKGLIKASSGSIGGIKMESDKIFTGASGEFSASGTGFYADSLGRFSLADKIGYDNTTSNFVMTPDVFTLESGKLDLSSADETVRFGDVTDFAKDSTDKGILIGKDGSDYEFFVGSEDGGHIHWDGSTLTVSGSIALNDGTIVLTSNQITGSDGAVGSSGTSGTGGTSGTAGTSGDDGGTGGTGGTGNTGGTGGAGADNTDFDFLGANDAAAISKIGAGNSGLFMSPDSLGFVAINGGGTAATWTAYMDDDGNFFLGDNTSNTAGYMSWNQSNTALAVQGTINARAGNFTSTVTVGKGATAGTLAVGTDSNTISIVGTNAAATTKIAASNGAFEILGDGNATFANGNITFEADGDITSRTFLIERSRLFGSGSDGTIQQYTDTVTAPSLTSTSGYAQGPFRNARGDTLLTKASSGNWRMDNDIYAQNYIMADNWPTTLDTNGYRLFVMDTLTAFDSNQIIHNDGANGSVGGNAHASTNGTGGSGGAAGGGGNLTAGVAGVRGGSGGESGTGPAPVGAGGGGGGGTGGFVFISARNISMANGIIRSHGGTGGAGGIGAL